MPRRPGHSRNENIWSCFVPANEHLKWKKRKNEHFITFWKRWKMIFWHESSFEVGSRVNILYFLEPIHLEKSCNESSLPKRPKGGIINCFQRTGNGLLCILFHLFVFDDISVHFIDFLKILHSSFRTSQVDFTENESWDESQSTNIGHIFRQ